MKTSDDLRAALIGLDGAPYPTLKKLKGSYRFGRFELVVDHVQGDPFADPSRARIRIPLSTSGVPNYCLENRPRLVGAMSHLALRFADSCAIRSRTRGSGKSGYIGNERPGQEVLATSAMVIADNFLETRFRVGLPADGRRVKGKVAADMLCRKTVDAVTEALILDDTGRVELIAASKHNEDSFTLRDMLDELGLIGFVGDGAILPRESGVSQLMLKDEPVAFTSPESLRVEVVLPHTGRVTGMGIPRGVTLIVGGGFHGKSTLLNALERGVYDHRIGDGRELTVTDRTAVKIRAEDGRAVTGVNISPFIGKLPGRVKTEAFSTTNGSGSTTQAANIVEALEMGSKTLLIDEDTSATNFMIRDHRMQRLVADSREPITPLLDRVRSLWTDLGVSTVLVMGGSGDYFDVADTVIGMDEYRPSDLTEAASEIAAKLPTSRAPDPRPFALPAGRSPSPGSLDPRRGRRDAAIKSYSTRELSFGVERIDLAPVSQLVHPGQTKAIGLALLRLCREIDGEKTLAQLVNSVELLLQREGLDVLSDQVVGDLCEFRRFELAGTLNRSRSLKISRA